MKSNRYLKSISPGAAGLFDGEGCIFINREKRKWGANYHLRASVKMTHLPTVERLYAMFPGSSLRGCPQGVKYRSQQYGVAWVSMAARRVIELLRPYLVTKAEEADLALAFPMGHGCGKWLLPGEQELRMLIYSQLSELKTRTHVRRRKETEKESA